MDGTKWSFTALDVNSVVINPISHIFAGAAGGVFRSMNDADQWSDVSSGLLPPGGNVWAVATGGLPPEDLPMPVLLTAVYFAASDQLPRRGSFRDRGPPKAGTATLRVWRFKKGNTCASLVYPRRPFGAASNLLKGSTHFGDSRVDASPRRNVS